MTKILKKWIFRANGPNGLKLLLLLNKRNLITLQLLNYADSNIISLYSTRPVQEIPQAVKTYQPNSTWPKRCRRETNF